MLMLIKDFFLLKALPFIFKLLLIGESEFNECSEDSELLRELLSINHIKINFYLNINLLS